ncbi:MAG: single-stranded DNA-binding protein [Methylococcaceae bacterium]|nr:single-stranded DNA-binding protein [Methylococcaceae bacterium]
MIDALISGKLIKAPQPLKLSRNGIPYCNFMLRVNQQDSDETLLCSGIAFGEHAEKIARLGKDDPLSVVGSLKLSYWIDNEGYQKSGLNITVSNCLTAYEVKKRRGTDKPKPSAQTQYDDQGYDFNDDIPI